MSQVLEIKAQSAFSPISSSAVVLTFCLLTFTEAWVFSSYPTGLIFFPETKRCLLWTTPGSSQSAKPVPEFCAIRKDNRL